MENLHQWYKREEDNQKENFLVRIKEQMDTIKNLQQEISSLKKENSKLKKKASSDKDNDRSTLATPTVARSLTVIFGKNKILFIFSK